MNFIKSTNKKSTSKKSNNANDNKKKFIFAGVVVLVVLLVLIFMSQREMMEDVFYLDQIGMKNTDPTQYKYTGRDKDVLGMSAKDYYLENGQYSASDAAPQLFKDNNRFKNQTDYLGMPSMYRPKSLAATKNLIE